MTYVERHFGTPRTTALRLNRLGRSQEEIGEVIDTHQTVVGDILREMAELPKTLKTSLKLGHEEVAESPKRDNC